MAEPTCASILNAASAAAALGLDAAAAPHQPAAVRSAFRRCALRVHPDKCDDPQASAAFRRLSEAFEEMTSPAVGSSSTRAAGHPPPANARRRRAPCSWTEWEAELRRQEEAERAFVELRSARFAEAVTMRTLRKARAVRVELDERAVAAQAHASPAVATGSKRRRRFSEEPPADRPLREWAPLVEAAESREEPGAEAPAEEANDAAALLAALLYLREEHLYCLFCAERYESAREMERRCPGILEDAHEDTAPGELSSDDHDREDDFGE